MSAASMTPSDMKLYIISNLLDISVNHPNLDMRRTYIGRILQLSKHVQKRLMAMIELRVKKQKESTPQKATSREVSQKQTPPRYKTPERSSTTRSDRETGGKRDSTPVRLGADKAAKESTPVADGSRSAKTPAPR